MRRQPECLSLPLWVYSQLTQFNICRTIWMILYKVKHAAEIKLAFFFYIIQSSNGSKRKNQTKLSNPHRWNVKLWRKKRVQNQRNKLHFITCLRILVSERVHKNAILTTAFIESTVRIPLWKQHTIIHEIFLNALTKHCDWAPNCYDSIQNAKSTYKHGTAQHKILTHQNASA